MITSCLTHDTNNKIIINTDTITYMRRYWTKQLFIFCTWTNSASISGVCEPMRLAGVYSELPSVFLNAARWSPSNICTSGFCSSICRSSLRRDANSSTSHGLKTGTVATSDTNSKAVSLQTQTEVVHMFFHGHYSKVLAITIKISQ